MEPLTFILLIVLGFFYAILASMIGIGGGLLYVPTLDFGFGLETIDATFVSSFVIVFTSTSGFLSYRSQNRIDMKTARIYLMYAVPGVLISSSFADDVPREILRQLFGILVVVAGIRGILKARKMDSKNNNNLITEEGPGIESRQLVDSDGNTHEYLVDVGKGKYLAFLGGFVAGLLGIGGGLVYVPLLTSISGLPIHIGAATSTSMIVVVSIIAVFIRTGARIGDGTFDFELWLNYGIPLIIGSVIGARYGSTKVKKLDSKFVLMLFWSVACVAGLRMLITPFI
ncbi:MAG: sulfite exporter TauE/SafE family protein [Candidatus Heimdallarchaeota archaeon]|nr:sulfite exporter TauE/SafE family protein [Candidatus Heimdallarchaeota archaeon]